MEIATIYDICMCRFASYDLFGDQFQDGFNGILQAVNYSTLLWAEDILQQRGYGRVLGTKTDRVGNHTEVQDMERFLAYQGVVGLLTH